MYGENNKMSKTVEEYFCQSCHSEYLITWDENYNENGPTYCPFCSEEKEEEDIMYYEEDI